MTHLLQHMALAAFFSGVLTVFLTPLVKRLAFRAGVVREPRERDEHRKPIPLWGGLSMFAAFLVTVLVMRLFTGDDFGVGQRGNHPILGILLGGTFVAIVGMLDDKYDLPPKLQALSLLIGGLIAALLGARIEGITNPFVPIAPSGKFGSENFLPLGVYSVPITMLWVFLVAKTFDFLDGLDGLAAGVCAISATTLGLMAAMMGETAVALMAAALVGACVGFLRHNYNPASIIMGTIGAQFLGFVLASLAVVGALKMPVTISVLIPLLVLGVPVFDGLFVIGRRLYLRKAPQQADRSHIHHRLRRRLTVKQTVWTIYTLTASLCVIALVLAWKFGR